MNPTYQKFCTPDTLIKDYDHWSLVLRPVQCTLGACIIVAKCGADVTSVGGLSPEAGAELPTVIADYERALRTTFGAVKFNYAALMMVDPHPHFHAVPRYETAPVFNGTTYPDTAWPKIVNMLEGIQIRPEQRALLLNSLKQEIAK
jgi:diadenosine tetraphosphate (Ap4A) HIT family hydrolase